MGDDYAELNRLRKEEKKFKSRNDYRELARVYNSRGEIFFNQGKYNEALREFQSEEDANLRVNDILGVAVTNRRIGECHAELGDYDEAIRHQEKHLELARETESLIEQQRAWATLGRTYLYQFEAINGEDQFANRTDSLTLSRAEEAFRNSLAICLNSRLAVPTSELEQMKGRLFLNFGLVRDYRNDKEGCIGLIERAINIHRNQNQLEDLYRSLDSLSNTYLKYKDLSKSLYHANEAADIALRLNDWEKQCDVCMHKGRIQMQMGLYYEAKTTLKKMYKASQTTGKQFTSIMRLLKYASNLYEEEQELNSVGVDKVSERVPILEKLGDLCSSVELYKKAIEYYHQALADSKSLGNTGVKLAPLYTSLAQTYMDDKQFENALTYYKLELDCWENNPEEECKTLKSIADCEFRLNSDYKKVAEIYLKAIAAARKSENRSLQKWCLSSLAEYQELNGQFDDNRVTLKSLQVYSDVKSFDEDLDSSDDEFALFLTDSDSDNDANPTAAKRKRNTKLKRNAKGESLLHRACISGKISTVKMLLEQNHPVNVRDNSGWQPLHEAANYGHTEICKLLISKGASVNDRGGNHCEGITPLHDAASNCHLETIDVLLEHGASCLAKTDKGQTVLDCLAEWRKKNEGDVDPVYIAESLKYEEKLRRMMKENIKGTLVHKDSTSSLKLLNNHKNSFKNRDGNKAALVSESDILPDSDNWIIDDIGKHNQTERKRRKNNLVSLTESLSMKTKRKSRVSNHCYSTKIKPSSKLCEKFERGKRKRSFSDEEDDNEDICNVNSYDDDDINIDSPTASLPESSELHSISDVEEICENKQEPLIQIGCKINVKVLETLFFIPVPKGETIQWLQDDAAQRYFLFSGLKPKLNFCLKENMLSPVDKVESLLENGHEITAQFQSWEVSPIQERYLEACKCLKIEPQNRIGLALAKSESFNFADFSTTKMGSLESLTVLRSFVSLTNLYEINFSGNCFEQQHLQVLAFVLHKLPHLHSLDISNCDIHDELLLHFVEYLKPLAKLEHLNIGYNPLLDDDCKHLVSLFKCLPYLRTLEMPSISSSTTVSKNLHGSTFTDLLTCLGNLRKLDISFTKFPISVLVNIISALKHLPLSELNLSSTVCSVHSVSLCHSLCDWLKMSTTTLTKLNLSMCGINDDCIEALQLGLKSRNLENLNLSGNRNLSNNSINTLLEIMQLKNLKLSSCPNTMSSESYFDNEKLEFPDSPTF